MSHNYGGGINEKGLDIGAGVDAVDYKLISICHKGDIVVSQDYGVATIALEKLILMVKSKEGAQSGTL